jgi:hypothetical protein
MFKKIKEQPKTRSDRELLFLIKENPDNMILKHELYARYIRLVSSHWGILTKQLTTTTRRELQDKRGSFYNDSYVEFSRALDAIDLNKIRDNNWKFLGYFGYYLKNLRISYIQKTIKKNKVERPIEMHYINPSQKNLEVTNFLPDYLGITTPSVEDEYIKKESQERIRKALKICFKNRWTKNQINLFLMKKDHKTIDEIHKKMGLTYYMQEKNLKQMRVILDEEFERVQV